MSDSTGRLALQFGGMAIGYMVGGPVGASVGGAIGGYAGNQIFPPEVPDGPRLEDLKVQSSAYGTPIPVVFGTWSLTGNIIWSSGLEEHKNEESVGGKGGGPERTVYSYTASFAVALCEGPVDGIRRIWADTTLIYDRSDGGIDPATIALGDGGGTLAGQQSMRVYTGTESQNPDPTIEAYEGAGEVPAHRGLVYLVFEDLLLTDYGNRIPQITAEVVEDGTRTLVNTGGYPALYLPDVTTSNNQFSIGPLVDGTVELWRDFKDGDWKRDVAWVDFRGTVVNKARHAVADNDPDIANVSASAALFHPSSTRNLGQPGGFYWAGDADDAELYDKAFGRLLTASQLKDDYLTLDAVSDAVFVDGVFYLVVSDLTSSSGAHARPRAFRVDTGGGVEVYELEVQADREEQAQPKLAYDPVRGSVYLVHQYHETYSLVMIRLDAETFRPQDYINLDGSWPGTKFSVYGDQVLVVDGISQIGDTCVIDEWTIDLSGPSISGGGIWFDADKGTADHPHIVHLAHDALFSVGHGLIRPSLTPQPYPLSDVFGRVCERAGLSAGQYDTSQVGETINGFAHTRPTEAKNDLSPLLQAFGIDAVESDGQIKFIPRGGAPVATIPEADLGAVVGGGETPDAVATTRVQELELPRRIGVQYADPERRNEQAEQYAERVTTEAVADRTVRVPVAISDQRGAELAQQMLIAEWVGRVRHSWQTPMRWAHLDPGDVVTIEGPQATYTSRIVSTEVATPARVAFQGVREDAAAYNPNAVAAVAQGSGAESQPVGPTLYEILDLPALRDGDNAPGYYAATSGLLPGWRGAQIRRSNDAGGWDVVATTETGTAIGTAIDALGDARTTVWDEGNTVTVRLSAGSALSSAAVTEVLNGANHAALGGEIIAWRDATDNGDGTYTLAGLLRGLFGTERNTAAHAAGDRFVHLTKSMARVELQTSSIGTSQTYEAVSLGATHEATDKRTVAGGGECLTPYAPVHIEATRNADGTLDLSWVRRARIGHEWRDFIDVPLAEQSEAYDVELLDGAGEVVLTDTVTNATSATLAPRYDQEGTVTHDVVFSAQVIGDATHYYSLEGSPVVQVVKRRLSDDVEVARSDSYCTDTAQPAGYMAQDADNIYLAVAANYECGDWGYSTVLVRLDKGSLNQQASRSPAGLRNVLVAGNWVWSFEDGQVARLNPGDLTVAGTTALNDFTVGWATADSSLLHVIDGTTNVRKLNLSDGSSAGSFSLPGESTDGIHGYHQFAGHQWLRRSGTLYKLDRGVVVDQLTDGVLYARSWVLDDGSQLITMLDGSDFHRIDPATLAVEPVTMLALDGDSKITGVAGVVGGDVFLQASIDYGPYGGAALLRLPFLSPTGGISKARIYQISDVVGRGHPGEITL